MLSCNISREANKQNINSAIILYNEGPWKTNFKNLVFDEILSKMYGAPYINCCLNNDASSSSNYDWLNYDSTIASSISTISTKFMERRYLSGTIEGKKVMMNYALQYRNSLELDSITGVFYFKYLQDSISKSQRY